MKFTSIALAVTIPTLAFAHPGGHDGGGEYRAPATAPAPVVLVVPDTLPALVTSLRGGLTAAETALAGLKISDLYRECTTLKTLAAAAPSRAVGLAPTDQATAAATATHLGAQADALISAATKNDTTVTKSTIAAIRSDIDTLAALVK